MDILHKAISLNGNWTIEGMEFEEGLTRMAYKPEYTPQDPVPAQVPGIVQSALLDAGRIDDPYWEMNCEKIIWIEEKEWWFFKDIEIPENPVGVDYELVFEGISYKADVWLDGITIGKLEGMFKRHRLNITRLVKPGQKSRLCLRMRALEQSSEDRPGGLVERGMVRSSGVVAPFSYWWNWSPHIVPIGLWKPVRLEITGAVHIGDPHVRTRIHWNECEEADYADLSVSFDIKFIDSRTKLARIQGVVEGEGFAVEGAYGDCVVEGGLPDRPVRIEKELEINAGSEDRAELRFRLLRPRLWWPNGMGEHPVYTLQLRAYDEKGKLSDTVETEFGIRELDFVKNDDDSWVLNTSGQSNRLWSYVGNPYPWTFRINRKRFFIRGSNWVPMDNLFRFTEERYRSYLDQVEDANLNLLRVWGGGIMETETFYRICNRKGILAWTEFWLACADYPVMPCELFIDNAIDMVKVLRNHPSLALWSGGNEFNADAPENKQLVDRLADVVAKYDPDRSFRRGSPYKGDRHGGLLMLPTRTSNKYGDVLNGEQRLTLFRTEVAVMRSVPVLESVKKYIGEDKLWPIDIKSWQYHHAVIKEQERDAREYGGTDNLERWIMSTQIAHGQNHRHNMEFCRQSKWWCSGCLQWQLNASWPAMHREIIDWWGIPKPAYFAYKRSSADYLVTVDMEKYLYDGGENFEAWVYAVSDTQMRTGDCELEVRIYSQDMTVVYEQRGMVTLEKENAVRAFKIEWSVPEEATGSVFFIYTEMKHRKTRLAGNLYWFGVSTYVRKKKSMDLNGPWQFQVGTRIEETQWNQCFMPSYWNFPPKAPEGDKAVFYRKKIVIPAGWTGTELELFCRGFEGNDRVYLNGTQIGATEEDVSTEMVTDDVVYAEKSAERQLRERGYPAEKSAPDAAVKKERQNVRVMC